jgi:hypothetical protein
MKIKEWAVAVIAAIQGQSMATKDAMAQIEQLNEKVRQLTEKTAGYYEWANNASNGLNQIPVLTKRLDELTIDVSTLKSASADIELPELPELPVFAQTVAQ